MIGIIVQARSRSKRFPRKIYAKVGNKYVLQRVLDGVTSSKLAHKVILAMPENDRGEIKRRVEKGELNAYLGHRGFSIYCGDPENLLKRYYDVAGINGMDLIVRVTADCPFIQGDLIDKMLTKYLRENCNGFMCNTNITGAFPDGMDIEIFPWWMLVDTFYNATSYEDKEHVTPYMHRTYDVIEYHNNGEIVDMHPKFSLDTKEELEFIRNIAEKYDQYGDINKALSEV